MTSGRTAIRQGWEQPQWSRPRIGRMTMDAVGGLLPVIGPQWSRPRIGRMTPQSGAARGRVRRAAMEPAEDRPDDAVAIVGVKGQETGPQWSRPRIGRMTLRPAVGQRAADVAAMEPAEDRPDDAPLVGVHPVVAAAAMEPAEDRPDDRPVDRRRALLDRAAMEPAEDRPDDVVAGSTGTGKVVPQWSRPRIGRMTGDIGAICMKTRLAAMEPAEDRPDDGGR